MKKNPPNNCRIKQGPMASHDSFGMNGAFRFWYEKTAAMLLVVVSDGSDWEACGFDGEPWEHVSVSVEGEDRCPTWEEMDKVRRMFWKDDETVIQLHVPRSRHVSFHDYCLHMWRPTETTIPLPPTMTVGPQS